MKKNYLEIRASEGGDDSKLLVGEMKNIYTRAAKNNGFDCNVVEEVNGFVMLCL
jgi:protein subunit release factor A